jgi:two-component system chemotaxis response regulator CheB
VTARPRLHVLVVDDSAVVRMAMGEILAREPDVSLAVASDPIIALERMRRVRPDVILLDLELPRMGGLEFLRRVMADDPIPVVVCSALAQRGADAALRATEEGAVAVVAKPRLDVAGFLADSATMLVDALRGAAEARVRRRGLAPARPALAPSRPAAPTPVPTGDTVVAIGASTGGTEALRVVLEALPADAPPVLIVQHMPEVFTRSFAERLNRSCRVEVREAQDRDRLRPGCALIAPGDRHLRLRRAGGRYEVDVADGPLVSRHRPSVDVLFHSVAEAAGAAAVGAIMTGMGRDGAAGLLAMRRAGAATLAQDEASCVVFGMPREAIELGAAGEVVPLERLASSILRLAGEPERAQRRSTNGPGSASSQTPGSSSTPVGADSAAMRNVALRSASSIRSRRGGAESDEAMPISTGSR